MNSSVVCLSVLIFEQFTKCIQRKTINALVLLFTLHKPSWELSSDRRARSKQQTFIETVFRTTYELREMNAAFPSFGFWSLSFVAMAPREAILPMLHAPCQTLIETDFVCCTHGETFRCFLQPTFEWEWERDRERFIWMPGPLNQLSIDYACVRVCVVIYSLIDFPYTECAYKRVDEFTFTSIWA